MLEKYITLFKAHERFLILTLVLAVVLHLGSKHIDTVAAESHDRAVIAQQQVVADKATASQDALQTAQTLAQYQAMVDTLTKQNASLASAIAQRQTTLASDQTVDKTSTLPDLVTRWDNLAGTTGLTASGDNVVVPDTDARKTVEMLEQVAPLTADLDDEKTVSANTQSELVEANKVNAANTVQITALNTEITDQQKECKVEVASVKAAARKSKFKWFKVGFVTGFVTGIWAGHSL